MFDSSVSMLTGVLQHTRVLKKTIASFIFLLAIVFLFAAAPDVYAQDALGINEAGQNLALSGLDPRVIIARIINAVLSLFALILVGLMVYAGFLWMTAAGNEEQIAKAKRTLTNAIIGLVIVSSSLAITRFLLNRIGAATGVLGDGAGNNGGRPPAESFIASGSLGDVIRDHYPFRNETDVKRNTRIVVTFVDAFQPSSTIRNTNNSCWNGNAASGDPAICDPDNDGVLDLPPYYGDCQPGANGLVCDELNTTSVKIAPLADRDALVEALAVTTYNADALAYTLTMIPKEPIGSDEENVDYRVELNNNVILQNGLRAFASDRDGRYEWQFETDTEFDVSAPTISSVYPAPGQVIPRNSIVKITFSEPVDPTVVQGMSGAQSPFNHIIFGDDAVEGEWRISNGYRTVEFLSSFPCGKNSCGDPMFCLPVDCNDPNDVACQTGYDTLVRTANKLVPDDPEAFASIPLTGVTDMAGNRLDGNADGQAQDKPAVGLPKVLADNEKAPDNYFWGFSVQNTIDREPPYIHSVTPPLDQERVDAFADLEVSFSKEMWTQTLYDIDIEEYPEARRDELGIPQIWRRAGAISRGGKTTAIVNHREFGPLGENFYYFVSVPGSVKSVTQNCLYPGNGPHYEQLGQDGNAPQCEMQFDERGNPVALGNNCVPVEINNANADTACARRVPRNNADLVQADIADCIDFLSDPVISPR